MSNEIHPTASIPDNTILGQFNVIGPHVTISGFKGQECGPIRLGDCNRLAEEVRIMVGPDGFEMGDYNVVHQYTTIGGPGRFVMGHNCWFGQEVWLDSTGGLTLGNGVRIGLRSHVWSHIASGEQIEGWLCAFRPTVLEDNVWLVGDDVHVASGVVMGARSAAMAHATVTRDTKPDTVYVGTPAREVGFRLRRDVTPEEKWEMMRRWAGEFADDGITEAHTSEDYITVHRSGEERLVIGFSMPTERSGRITYFDLTTKTYTKQLTQLERDFMKYLLGNKARFLPV